VSPYWIDQPEMKRGNVEFLASNELQFWKDLIDTYLHPLIKNAKVSVVTSISAVHFPTLNIPIL
jgi:hypothetical protein